MTVDADTSVGDEILRVEGAVKRYGAVTALAGADLRLERGEILGIVGDNGAGKSTLLKILSGFHTADEGRILIENKDVHFRSVGDARRHGIETAYQDLALVNQLTVYQNLFLAHEEVRGGRLGFLSSGKMRELARRYLNEIKVDIPSIDMEVERLSGGQRKAIAVARACRSPEIKILLLDEPLAAMGTKEAVLIMDLVKSLAAAQRVSIVMVDHNYAHIFEMCDRVNVMQQGRVTFDRSTKETSVQELTDLVVSEYRTRRDEYS